MICNAKLSNSSLAPGKLKEYFLKLHRDGKYKATTLTTMMKKLFTIDLVPDIPEKYHNVLTMREHLKLNDASLPFTLATYLKLANIMVGLMAHGSNHPCIWCDIHKEDLFLVDTGVLRTFDSVRNLFNDWRAAESVKAPAVNFPIFEDYDAEPVLVVVPPHELHLLIGPVTTKLNGMKSKWPKADN